MRDVGVTCARFQTNKLTPAHIELINIMFQTHKRIIVVLGLQPIKFTTKNPLDFQMRKGMIFEALDKRIRNNITILYLSNTKDDVKWCNDLDALIAKNTSSKDTIRYCGGRDSFLKQYKESGNKLTELWEIKDFEQSEFVSATLVRKEIAASTEFDERFRAGVIYTALNTPAKTVPTVDVAIIKDANKVLIGKRHDENEWRFIGVWSQPRESYEEAALRAAKQKANIIIEKITPRKSFCNYDWKFKGEIDDITTMFYTAHYKSGTPEPIDNLAVLKWIDIIDLSSYFDKSADHYNMADYLMELYLNKLHY